jgi:transposase-like protein
MNVNITDPIFHDEAKALAHLEADRWPDGETTCPHCGSVRTKRMGGKTQAGMFLCNDCRDKFTVRTGTVMERSHVPLHKWLLATHLMAASKKGMSALQLSRMLGVTYKTAWFLAHRIREAMRSGALAPFGGEGGVVEVDETFIGTKSGAPRKHAYHHKMPVLSLVHRESGQVRSFHVDEISQAALLPIVFANVDRETYIMTDEASHYRAQFRNIYLGHGRVNHSRGEYARGRVSTNTIEGFFSIFKRGMKGVYQHCGEKHLHRYLAEFDFRYNNRAAHGFNDEGRSVQALRGIVGKRLTYARPD